jgi:hypothetical protein
MPADILAARKLVVSVATVCRVTLGKNNRTNKLLAENKEEMMTRTSSGPATIPTRAARTPDVELASARLNVT